MQSSVHQLVVDFFGRILSVRNAASSKALILIEETKMAEFLETETVDLVRLCQVSITNKCVARGPRRSEKNV